MPGYGAPDPNIVRASPASMPVGDPLTGAPSPLVPGFGTPVTGPAPFSNPDLAYQPDYAWGFQIAPDVTEGQGNTPSVPSGPSVPSRPTPIRGGVKREPPKRGEKQRKVITRSAQIGIALFRALDAISESAEVVDALFEALPEDVQKRWKRAHADDGEYRRLLDTAGQYGIDGADWKLQALYYNWHLLDVEQGLKNILKNALSDRIVGGIQRELPRNTGNALSQSEMELNEWLDWAFSTGLGL